MTVHDEKTVLCWGDKTHGNKTLTFEEHGSFVRSPPRDLGFESAALRFDCPECEQVHWMCPVCSDPDDHSPAGWFRGESSGETLPCINCNQEEISARKRRGLTH